jgi:CheY-like chemotaxis protein
MRTMFEDGLDKAARGLTTIEELLSVASLDEAAEPPPPSVAVPRASPAITVSAATPESPSSSSSKRRVLIVEDSPTIASVVQYFLELEGFTVMRAADGRAGLQMALEHQPDIIVSDVSMPLMTGVEMVRALRSDPRGRGVRILMLTAESSVESEAAGLEAGADDYILKPVEPRRLAVRVKALLGRGAVAPA